MGTAAGLPYLCQEINSFQWFLETLSGLCHDSGGTSFHAEQKYMAVV